MLNQGEPCRFIFVTMPTMIGSLLLLAAAHSPARAKASVRIISGVGFGAGRSVDAAGAILRAASLTDQDGQRRSAKLLEFQ
jgi:hypothetical protein